MKGIIKNVLILISITSLLFGGFMVAGLSLTYFNLYDPGIDHVFEVIAVDQPYKDSLTFQESDLQEISSSFNDEKELAWCGNLLNKEVTNIDKVAEGSYRSISFACNEVSIHTHPGFFASAELSQPDLESLKLGSESISCVVAGKFPIEDDPVSMNCYGLDENSELFRYNIQVES